jgi:hypothetical protein
MAARNSTRNETGAAIRGADFRSAKNVPPARMAPKT